MKKTTPSNHLTITHPEGREVVRLEVRFPEGLHYRKAHAFLHRLAAELEQDAAENPLAPTYVIQTTGVGLLGGRNGSMGSVEIELGTAGERTRAEMALTMLRNNYNNGRIRGLEQQDPLLKRDESRPYHQRVAIGRRHQAGNSNI